MVDKRIYEILKNVARKKQKIHYKELAEIVGIPFETSDERNRLFRKLGHISTYEVSQGRPMLSAVVVHHPSFDKLQMPGEGFFDLAIELNRWDGTGDRRRFFYNEVREVWGYWSRQ